MGLTAAEYMIKNKDKINSRKISWFYRQHGEEELYKYLTVEEISDITKIPPNRRLIREIIINKKTYLLSWYIETKGEIPIDNYLKSIKTPCCTLEFYILRYGETKGEERYKANNKLKDSGSLKFFTKKYGETKGRLEYNKSRKKLSYMGTKQRYIDEHGIVEGTKLYKARRLKSVLSLQNMVEKMVLYKDI